MSVDDAKEALKFLMGARPGEPPVEMIGRRLDQYHDQYRLALVRLLRSQMPLDVDVRNALASSFDPEGSSSFHLKLVARVGRPSNPVKEAMKALKISHAVTAQLDLEREASAPRKNGLIKKAISQVARDLEISVETVRKAYQLTASTRSPHTDPEK
jgi:hypothetical protein